MVGRRRAFRNWARMGGELTGKSGSRDYRLGGRPNDANLLHGLMNSYLGKELGSGQISILDINR
jgi:hypothetical protein